MLPSSTTPINSIVGRGLPLEMKSQHPPEVDDGRTGETMATPPTTSRRSVLSTSSMAIVGGFATSMLGKQFVGGTVQSANAAVGTLPEFESTNAILQGITVNVADKSQQDAMITFLTNGFDFKVLRKRIQGSIEDTVRVLIDGR